MKNAKNGSAISNRKNNVLHCQQVAANRLDEEWFKAKTTWEDMERRLEEYEREQSLMVRKKLWLNSTCAMRQLQGILRKVKPAKRFFKSEYSAKAGEGL